MDTIFWSASVLVGDVDGRGLENTDEFGGGHLEGVAAVSGVDVESGEVEDGALDVDGHASAGAEGAGAAAVVPRVVLGDLGVARTDALDAQLPRQVLLGDAAVAVHEDDQRLLRVGLEDERLDDEMLVDAEFAGDLGGSAVFDVVVEMLVVDGLLLLEQADGGGDGWLVLEFGHG